VRGDQDVAVLDQVEVVDAEAQTCSTLRAARRAGEAADHGPAVVASGPRSPSTWKVANPNATCTRAAAGGSHSPGRGGPGGAPKNAGIFR